MLYIPTSRGQIKVARVHDPDSKQYADITYRPGVWQANTVYYHRETDDYDAVIATTFNGLYYKVINPGLAGATEPTWPTTVGATVKDGGIVWEAVAYNLLPPTESISTSTWVATDGVTIDQQTSTTSSAQCRIAAVPVGVTGFSLTNHTVKSNGEEDDVTLQFKVGSR